MGIAGAKDFAGGFGRGSLGAWGEPAIKQFVQEALHEAMKLESALAKLRTPRRIALLHYSPIVGTVEGEPVEIFPFLGSSRLEEPLLRYPVDAVCRPDQPPFRLFELPHEAMEAPAGAAQQPAAASPSLSPVTSPSQPTRAG